ncbi:Krr1-domain-containing protein [Russula earlei]|uniref:Krr1-domain-containing protein n=1 Tax=Russula earlei TaxID=71964 RepID=A0ACC0UJF3_9AGAM|nr:Krr1-domain-containing protein [Russula earlei]
MEEEFIPFSSSSASEDGADSHQLTINEHYAKAFQRRKEREELTKLKERYGSDADTDDLDSYDSDSESDESEDEDGEELTPALDAAILRTLARIKARDPGIYDTDRNVLEEEHSKSGTLSAPPRTKKTKARKAVTLPQQRLAAALDDATTRSDSPEDPSLPLTHAAEQAALRAETISAFHSRTALRDSDTGGAEQGEEEGEGEGGLTRDEVEQDEAEYRAYLEREVGPLEKILDLGEQEGIQDGARRKDNEDVDAQPGETSPGGKRKKKRKKDVEERKETDQEFLINYILHRGWIDRSARRVPTYEEITVGTTSHQDPGPSVTPSGADAGANGELLEDDDEFDEVADRFESSYNFRFEEPDAAYISSFPRAHAERRREAQVKRLKGLKTREMEAKLERIGKEGGWARSRALEALDLDGDWDAAAHDRQMAAVLAEASADGVGFDEDEKPTWDDDIDVGDIIPPPSGDKSPHASQKRKRAREVDMGADTVDIDEMDADAVKDGGKEMRKRVLDQYMEELYELEFNDMVAGMPTRFRYTPVAKTSYSLTPADILLAEDKDLNEYVGLKKLAPYRKQRETWDAKRAERLGEFKRKVSERATQAGVDVAEHAVAGERKAKKRKGKKERMRERATEILETEATRKVETKTTDSPRQNAKHAKRRYDDGEYVDIISTSEPVKKKRRRQKKAEKQVEDI